MLRERSRMVAFVAALAGSLIFSRYVAATQQSPSSTGKEALRTVIVKLDYTPIQSFMLPVVVAADKGYYRSVNLSVDISEGSDSTSTISAVDSGHADIGFADAGQAAIAISKGAKLKVIASYLQKTQGVVIAKTSEGIKKPSDLIGKTVAATEGSSSASLFLALLKISNVSRDQVQMMAVTAAAKVPALLQGQVQAVTGFATAACIHAQTISKIPVSCLMMADFGVTALGESLIVSDKLIRSDPGMLKDFVRATNRAWADSIKNPAAAAEAGVKQFPLADQSLLKTQLTAVEPYLHTEATKGKPLGYMADSDWVQTLSFLRTYRGMTSDAPTSDFYFNVGE
jgi:NitT/TauT family transport system substrate-binding protein